MPKAPQTLTVLETHQLLDSLLPKDEPSTKFAKGIRNYTIALLMLDAGLRVGEVLRLTWPDLYVNATPVHVLILDRQLAEKSCERAVPLSSRLSAALGEHYLHNHPQDTILAHLSAFYATTPHKPLTARQVQRIINAAATRSIGRPIHPHILRHTFATKLMRKTDMRTVQTLLGHKHLSSTQVYTHPNGDDLKAAIESLTA